MIREDIARLADQLRADFKRHGLLPVVPLHVSGSASFVFYVDENDDRYVEVSTSTRSLNLLVVLRDESVVEAYVMSDVEAVMETVEKRLAAWTRRYHPR